MNEFFELILAAGRKQRDFSWIFPLVLFIVYGISAVGKAFQNKQSQQQEDKKAEEGPLYKPIEPKQQQRPLTPEQRRAQRLPYAPKQPQQQQRQVAPRPVQPDRHLEPVVFEKPTAPVARPVTRKLAPRPIPTAVRKRTHAAQARKVSATKKQAAPPSSKQPMPRAEIVQKPASNKSRLAQLLTDKNDLRRGIIYSEIFGKPIAFRDQL